MKDYFDNQIKPLNDNLGTLLRINNIKVRHESNVYLVPVNGMVRTKHGNFTKSQLDFFKKGLGLMI